MLRQRLCAVLAAHSRLEFNQLSSCSSFSTITSSSPSNSAETPTVSSSSSREPTPPIRDNHHTNRNINHPTRLRWTLHRNTTDPHSPAVYRQLVPLIQQAATCSEVVHIITSRGGTDNIKELTASLQRLGELQKYNGGRQNLQSFLQIYEMAEGLFERFDAQGLALTVWAAARFGWKPPQASQLAWEEAVVSQLAKFKPSEAAMCMYSFGALNWKPRHLEIIQTFISKALEEPEKLESRMVASILYGISKTRSHPGSDLVQQLVKAGVVCLPKATGHCLSRILFSLAVLRERPDDSVLRPYVEALSRHLTSMTAFDLANVAWSLGSLRCTFAIDTVWPALVDEIDRRSQELPPRAAGQIFCGATRIGGALPDSCVQGALRAVQGHVEAMRMGDIGWLLYGLAKLGYKVDGGRDLLTQSSSSSFLKNGQQQQHGSERIHSSRSGLNGDLHRVDYSPSSSSQLATEVDSLKAPTCSTLETRSSTQATAVVLKEEFVTLLLEQALESTIKRKFQDTYAFSRLSCVLWGAATVNAQVDESMLDDYLYVLEEALKCSHGPPTTADATMLLYAFDAWNYLPGFRFLKQHVVQDNTNNTAVESMAGTIRDDAGSMLFVKNNSQHQLNGTSSTTTTNPYLPNTARTVNGKMINGDSDARHRVEKRIGEHGSLDDVSQMNEILDQFYGRRHNVVAASKSARNHQHRSGSDEEQEDGHVQQQHAMHAH